MGGLVVLPWWAEQQSGVNITKETDRLEVVEDQVEQGQDDETAEEQFQ